MSDKLQEIKERRKRFSLAQPYNTVPAKIMNLDILLQDIDWLIRCTEALEKVIKEGAKQQVSWLANPIWACPLDVIDKAKKLLEGEE